MDSLHVHHFSTAKMFGTIVCILSKFFEARLTATIPIQWEGGEGGKNYSQDHWREVHKKKKKEEEHPLPDNLSPSPASPP